MIRARTVVGVALLAVAGCSSGSAPARPVTAGAIRAVFAAIHEVDYPDERFVVQDRVTAPGGYTAAVGVRDPSADGKGMIVGFWHNGTFVGLAQDFEVLAVSAIRGSGPGRFTVSYVNYRDSDPLCCPSGKPAVLPIDYHWDGTRFVSDKPLPENLYRSDPEHVVVP